MSEHKVKQYILNIMITEIIWYAISIIPDLYNRTPKIYETVIVLPVVVYYYLNNKNSKINNIINNIFIYIVGLIGLFLPFLFGNKAFEYIYKLITYQSLIVILILAAFLIMYTLLIKLSLKNKSISIEEETINNPIKSAIVVSIVSLIIVIILFILNPSWIECYKDIFNIK